MNIISFIVFSSLFFCFFILKKSNKKISFTKNLFIAIVIFMSIVCFQMYFLDLVGFKLSNVTLIIFNLLLISIFLMLFKNKIICKQKLFLDKEHLIVNIIFLFVTFIIFILLFTFKFNVSFSCSDAAAHFLSSKYFSLNNTIDGSINIDRFETFNNGFQFFFYVNLGLLYKLFPSLTMIYQYNIFVLYNLFIFFLIGVGFFYLIDNINTKIDKKTFVSKLLFHYYFY